MSTVTKFTNDGVIEKQKDCLMQTIRECKRAEVKRIMRLDAEKDRDARKQLEKRYDAERNAEKERIMRLTEDFSRVNNAIKSGELDLASRNPEAPKFQKSSVNRFAGLETETDLIFHKDFWQHINQFFFLFLKRMVIPYRNYFANISVLIVKF